MHFATPALLGAPTLARDTPALPALQDSLSFSPSLYHQPSRERRPSNERLCNRWVSSCAKRFPARHGEGGAFRIGNLVRFSRRSQQVLLVREEEEWRTGPVQGSSGNDEAARMGLDEPKSLAKRLGTQLPGAREMQARKHGLMTCSITIRCGKPPPRWHCASLRGGGWGQWYYQSVRGWQVRSVWGTWRRKVTGRMGKVGGKKTWASASVKMAKSTECGPTVSSEQVVRHQFDFRECALFVLSACCSVRLAVFSVSFTPKASSRVRAFNGVQHASLPVFVLF